GLRDRHPGARLPAGRLGPPDRRRPAGAALGLDRQVDRLPHRVRAPRVDVAARRRAVPAGRARRPHERGLTALASDLASGWDLAPPAPTAYHRLNPLTKATIAIATTVVVLALGGVLTPLTVVAVAVLPAAWGAGVVGRIVRAAVIAA